MVRIGLIARHTGPNSSDAKMMPTHSQTYTTPKNGLVSWFSPSTAVRAV